MIVIRPWTPRDPMIPVELFFEGWPVKPCQKRFDRALSGAGIVFLAEEDGLVVGFIAGLTDGALCAFISLLEVLPICRGRGVGTQLVEAFIAECRDLYACDLVCDPDLVPFYEQTGFTPYTAMIKRNRGSLP